MSLSKLRTQWLDINSRLDNAEEKTSEQEIGQKGVIGIKHGETKACKMQESR